jgi:hypothetical protein
MSTIYVKKFNKKIYKCTSFEHPFSSYFPKPMLSAFNNEFDYNIRSSDYILGPLYKSGDFQVGVTGHVKRNEDNNQAIARELGEEIGIVPKNYSKLFKIGTYLYKKSNMPVYSLYIKDSINVLDSQQGANLSKENDTKKKVGCFVYGRKADILKILQEDVYRYNTDDDIIGIVAVMAKDVLNYYIN